MPRTAPRRTTVAVGVLLLAVSIGLSALTWQVTQRSEEQLLERQLAQVGSLLTSQAGVLRVQLADMGQVAVATNGNPNAFARFADAELEQTGQSLSLWKIGDGGAERVALQGVDPLLPPGGTDAIAALEPTGELVMLGVVPGSPARLAYAVMPADDNTEYVVYAETPLPPEGRMPEAEGSPVHGLDLALYLGDSTDETRLLQSTADVPIGGDPLTLTVPFGNTEVTVVGASRSPLTGELAAALPWILLGVGTALAVAGAGTLEYVSRRRADAERLAADNERLYREQRGIAGTLQHALLPAVADLEGVQVAARYVAGVDDLDVGGDWYDVIAHRPGCLVFVVGDVSGRGLPAATTMAALRFGVRAYLSEGHDISGVLRHLRGLLDIEFDHQFATVLLGQLDTASGQLRLLSAGHFAPLLISEGGARLLECPPGPPVGVDAGPDPDPITVTLSGPSTLLAFTDGLVERPGEDLDVGLERLATVAGRMGSQPLARVVDDVLATLTADAAKDDTVLLGMRWTASELPRTD